MTLHATRGLEPVTLADCTGLVIANDRGEPIAFALEYLPGCFQVKHVGEDGFARALHAAGLDRVALPPPRVEIVEGPKLNH